MNSVTYNADCLEMMKALPDNSVDCVITDPPYFLPAKHYATRKEFQRNFGDLGILESWFHQIWKEMQRILRDTGSFYIFCDGQIYPLFYYYAYFFTKNARPLIWDKQTAFTGYGWRHQHEIILWGEMPKAAPIPTGDGDVLKCRAVPVNERCHPAEKPIELLQRLIRKSTTEGQTVLDFTMGSGSTGVACELENRNFIGIEKDADYFAIAQKRIADVKKKEPLFAAA